MVWLQLHMVMLHHSLKHVVLLKTWNPLLTQVQKLETRAVGPAINVFTNFLFTFIIGQVFLTMMCAMKWYGGNA